MIRSSRDNAIDPKQKSALQSGFSLVEVVITAALSVVVLGVGISVIGTGRDASKSTVALMDVDEKVRKVLQRFAQEIRFASRKAEDSNGNDILDSGEDTNNNTRFEDDWSVGSGTVTFNRRLPNRTFSLPISYKLIGKKLVRIETVHPNGRTQKSILLRNVTQFDLTASTRGMKVTLTVAMRNADGKTVTRTDSITVTQRN